VIFVERPVLRRVLLALIVIAAVACLGVGTFVGMLWATSHPERAPHGGLLLGLPGGLLFLQGLLLGLGALWISRRWRGYMIGGLSMCAALPLALLVSHHAMWVGGFVGLAPFAALAWLIRTLTGG
jgi:hypothetical protein